MPTSAEAEPAAEKGRASGTDFDVIVVGAGFAGLYMLHRLHGMGFSVRVLEAGSGVGGTWYWNRYPGARCDVESAEYSYQFSPELQQEWDWSERYAAQPEILRYANHVADRFDLRRDIDFDTRVTTTTFDEAANHWTIETDDGARISANFCVMATGCLSVPNQPKFKGTDTFAGPTYHTGTWPHEGVDFTGQHVGIIGTGSSAVQSIPIIAQQAAHLYVFQRTPSFVVPARNAPLSQRERQAIKDEYPALRALAKTRRNGLFCATADVSALAVSDEERKRAFRERWDRGGLCYTGTFNDLLIDKRANESAADFLRARIREVVNDPKVADALSPSTVVGGKRLCIDIGYYETFNRDNVTLIDLNKAPLEEITHDGLIAGGKSYELDSIIYAIGFDAMTGALTRMDIRGKDGVRLSDKWAEGPRTYLGLSVAGFPNLFTITGPGSPSVLTNMLPTIEQHVEWIADCIGYLHDQGLSRIEATPDAETAWVARVNEIADGTLFPTCDSWYLGANVPGKPRVFMPYIGFPPYVEKCNEVAASGYAGFALS
jgi:cation diffusion facilitator CzcD-associated flavoprotein CzcO